MRRKFSFLYIDIYYDVPKCKFIMQNSTFRMLVVFPVIFVADTKLIYGYNFVTPLDYYHNFQFNGQ